MGWGGTSLRPHVHTPPPCSGPPGRLTAPRAATLHRRIHGLPRGNPVLPPSQTGCPPCAPPTTPTHSEATSTAAVGGTPAPRRCQAPPQGLSVLLYKEKGSSQMSLCAGSRRGVSFWERGRSHTEKRRRGRGDGEAGTVGWALSRTSEGHPCRHLQLGPGRLASHVPPL